MMEVFFSTSPEPEAEAPREDAAVAGAWLLGGIAGKVEVVRVRLCCGAEPELAGSSRKREQSVSTVRSGKVCIKRKDKEVGGRRSQNQVTGRCEVSRR